MFDPIRVRRDIDERRLRPGPEAPRAAARRFGGRNWPKTFADRLTAPLPGMRDVVKMMREAGPRTALLADAPRIPVTRAPVLPRAEAGQILVTWVGHATYVVQIGGLTVLTDPVWSRRIPGVPTRLTPQGVDWSTLPPIDAVGEIGGRYPGLDLALMPVGAYEPSWFMRPVHLHPDEAVRACLDLGAKRMATMHWGTFMLSAEPLLEPVERAVKAWAEAGQAREDLWNLAVGETRALPQD
jgi:hypothetical protein